MDIREYDLILSLDPNLWIWKKDILYYKELKLTPFLEIGEDQTIFLYVNLYNENKFTKLLRILINSPFEFYLVTNQLNDPKVRRDQWLNLSLEAYFQSLLDYRFYSTYKNLNWDVVANIIQFTNKYGSVESIWESYNLLLTQVDKKQYDHVTGEYNYKIWDEEVRDNFKSLQRDIQLQLLFNQK